MWMFVIIGKNKNENWNHFLTFSSYLLDLIQTTTDSNLRIERVIPYRNQFQQDQVKGNILKIRLQDQKLQ